MSDDKTTTLDYLRGRIPTIAEMCMDHIKQDTKGKLSEEETNDLCDEVSMAVYQLDEIIGQLQEGRPLDRIEADFD